MPRLDKKILEPSVEYQGLQGNLIQGDKKRYGFTALYN